jgi:hypothetical protein
MAEAAEPQDTVLALRDALTRIGFTQGVSAIITDDQGLRSIHEFIHLSDSAVDNLCKVICQPGGQIAHPLGGNRQPISDQGNAISL